MRPCSRAVSGGDQLGPPQTSRWSGDSNRRPLDTEPTPPASLGANSTAKISSSPDFGAVVTVVSSVVLSFSSGAAERAGLMETHKASYISYRPCAPHVVSELRQWLACYGFSRSTCAHKLQASQRLLIMWFTFLFLVMRTEEDRASHPPPRDSNIGFTDSKPVIGLNTKITAALTRE